jgi:hypothetical protein
LAKGAFQETKTAGFMLIIMPPPSESSLGINLPMVWGRKGSAAGRGEGLIFLGLDNKYENN